MACNVRILDIVVIQAIQRIHRVKAVNQIQHPSEEPEQESNNGYVDKTQPDIIGLLEKDPYLYLWNIDKSAQRCKQY